MVAMSEMKQMVVCFTAANVFKVHKVGCCDG